MPHSEHFLWANAAPHLVLLTLYACDVRSPWAYRVLIGLGILIAVVSCAYLRRGWKYYAAFAVLWTPLVITANVMQYRTTIYISLFFLYAMCAIAFSSSLPRKSRGKIVVVAGFVVWSLCFVTHPWIAMSGHPDWVSFASKVWDMQKFIITVGFLLVLLEGQLRSSEWLALHDELTNLPNRRLFDDRLQYALARAGRDGHRVALFNLDLDGFKQINDTLGHDAGDTVLRNVADNLQSVTRRTDTLARIGGDEFSLIAVGIGSWLSVGETDIENVHPADMPQALRIHANMMQAVELPVELGETHRGAVAQISASVGVAIFPDDGTEAAELMRLADQRMYRQKAARAEARRLAIDAEAESLLKV
jgi:diguanylate cyclase (GGDEF)-like protein